MPLLACDLDGVVWVGDEPVPGAASAIERLRDGGVRLLFLTNNSSLSVSTVVTRLAAAGVDASRDEVLTSGMAAAALLAGELGRGSRVVACAGEGVVEALGDRGFEVVDAWPCDAVVVGWHRHFDFDRLHRASDAVRRGARFVATNLDPTYPLPRGLVPGNGALVAAVATAAGIEPEVAGKPWPPTVDLVRERSGGVVGAVVGDRPSTDGELAEALGWPFVLVRSDVTATEAGREPLPAVEGAGLRDVVGDVLALLERAPGRDALG